MPRGVGGKVAEVSDGYHQAAPGVEFVAVEQSVWNPIQ